MLLDIRGLLPDHSKLYAERKRNIQLYYARQKAAVLRKVARDESVMKAQQTGQLTVDILLSMTPNELGWFERVAKQVYLANLKRLGKRKAFGLALQEAERAERKRSRYAAQDTWIRHGTITTTKI